MRRHLYITLATLAILGGLVAVGPSEAATTTTTVVKVVDGDTIDAEVFGVVQRVRMLGINATETGVCHAEAAKLWLKDRIEGRSVQLTAKDPNVKLNFGRPARFIDLDGDDIGAEMIELGLVIPYPHPTETARNDKYLDLAAEARQRGVGIWDDDACGSGPAQAAGLELLVRWDAEEDDSLNVNGEWIDVYNPSDAPVSLTGWHVRDASTRTYEFPRGTRVPAGSYVRVHVGRGTDTPTRKYWGIDHPIFDNKLDEITYLFDPDGDLRASFEYQCRIDCYNDYTDIILNMNVDAPGDDNTNINGEWIDVINTGPRRLYMYGTYVEAFPYALHFEPQHSIAAHSNLRIFVGRGTDRGQTLFMNKTVSILTNAGETATLRRKDGLILEELVWPTPFVSCTRTLGPPENDSPTVESDLSAIGGVAAGLASANRLGVLCS
jgi:endonuclease YncB( thermonuclease family)